jgi:hypothetical protein
MLPLILRPATQRDNTKIVSRQRGCCPIQELEGEGKSIARVGVVVEDAMDEVRKAEHRSEILVNVGIAAPDRVEAYKRPRAQSKAKW